MFYLMHHHGRRLEVFLTFMVFLYRLENENIAASCRGLPLNMSQPHRHGASSFLA
jgi:hypothetical protein